MAGHHSWKSQISPGKKQGAKAEQTELVNHCCTRLEVLDLRHPLIPITVITSMRQARVVMIYHGLGWATAQQPGTHGQDQSRAAGSQHQHSLLCKVARAAFCTHLA